MSTVRIPSFSPHPDTIDGIILDIAREDLSFNDLAARHNTSPEAIALWMTTPGIRERLAAAADLVAWRTQFLAANKLHAALATLGVICSEFSAHAAERRTAPSTQPAAPIEPDPIRAAVIAVRRAETARRAASTILRLSTISSVGAPTVHPLQSAPAEPALRQTPAPTPANPPANPPLKLAPVERAPSPRPAALPQTPVHPSAPRFDRAGEPAHRLLDLAGAPAASAAPGPWP